MKTRKYRIVPIHPHLVEQGLLAFISDRPSGPLFFASDKIGPEAARAAKVTSGKVGQWVRESVGITEKRIWPNHAWRHRFKTLCRGVGIDQEIRDAILGHIDGTAAADYGEVSVKAMQRAIEVFPRIEVSVSCGKAEDK